MTQSGRDGVAAAAFCKSETPLRDLIVGDTFQDRRQPGHQDAAPGPAMIPSTTARFRTASFATSFSQSETSSCSSQSLRNGSSALHCKVSRHATAWAESLEGATSGHQSWAVLCRNPCCLLLPEVPKGTDRNAELKLRLRLWEAAEVSELVAKI